MRLKDGHKLVNYFKLVIVKVIYSYTARVRKNYTKNGMEMIENKSNLNKKI